MNNPNARVVPLRPAKAVGEVTLEDLKHAMTRLIVLEAKADLKNAIVATEVLECTMKLAKNRHLLTREQRREVHKLLAKIQGRAMDDQMVQSKLHEAIEKTDS